MNQIGHVTWRSGDFTVPHQGVYIVGHAAFERDRVRDAELQQAWHRILRVTDRRLSAEGAGVVETARSLLGLSA